MTSYRADGTRMTGASLCRLGDYETCGAAGCSTVVYRTVPYNEAGDGAMTTERTPEAGDDRRYRTRCATHAEPHRPYQPAPGTYLAAGQVWDDLAAEHVDSPAATPTAEPPMQLCLFDGIGR